MNSNNDKESKSLGQRLSTLFEIKFLGKMRYFFGIKAAYFNQGIFISQHMYTLDLIKETDMMDCKPSSNSIDPNTKLSLHEEDSPTNKRYYQIFVEKVIYLNYTRPNIALVVGLLSKFMHNPKEINLLLHRVLAYLKGTAGQGQLFKRGRGTSIDVYIDANYGGFLTN